MNVFAIILYVITLALFVYGVVMGFKTNKITRPWFKFENIVTLSLFLLVINTGVIGFSS